MLVGAIVYKYRCILFGTGWVLDRSGVDDDVITAGDRRTGEEVAVVWVLDGSGVDDDDVIAAGDRRTGEEVAVVWVLDGSGFPVLSRAGNRTAHLRLVPGES